MGAAEECGVFGGPPQPDLIPGRLIRVQLAREPMTRNPKKKRPEIPPVALNVPSRPSIVSEFLARIPDSLIGFALALFALLVYARTLAPSFSTMDSGELAATTATLGIAHPTGYPLFTLLGYAFSRLPLGSFTVIQKLNLLSALYCAGAVYGFYHAFRLLLIPPRSASSVRNVPPADTALAAGIAAATFAFSRTFWAQAVSIEVYSLHLLLISLILWTMLRATRDPESRPKLFLAAFVFGLAFTNHLSTFFLVPGVLYFYFAAQRNASGKIPRRAFASMAWATLPFAAALTPYLYLPLRAAREPLLAWGDMSTWQGFLYHITGKQYTEIMFESFDMMKFQLQHFFEFTPPDFGYLPLAFSLLGLVTLYKRNRIILFFSLLLFFTCVGCAIGYGIPDIEPYFLVAQLAIVLWMAHGLQTVLSHFKAGLPRAITICLGVALALIPLTLHYESQNHREDYAIEDYARNMLEGVDSGAIVISEQEMTFIFPTFYLQHVERFREDVAVVEPELLWLPWYYAQLERSHPTLFSRSRPEVSAYLKAFARNPLHPDFPALKPLRSAVLQSLIENNKNFRSVYVTPDINEAFMSTLNCLPVGLALKVQGDSAKMPDAGTVFRIRPLRRNSPYYDRITQDYAWAYVNQARFSLMGNDLWRARVHLQNALSVRPGYAPALEILRTLPY